MDHHQHWAQVPGSYQHPPPLYHRHPPPLYHRHPPPPIWNEPHQKKQRRNPQPPPPPPQDFPPYTINQQHLSRQQAYESVSSQSPSTLRIGDSQNWIKEPYIHDRFAQTGKDGSAGFKIYVGGLAPDVTDDVLAQTFKAYYASIIDARVVMDKARGCKGFGFVTFADECEQKRAMSEMNGKFCSNKPMRVGPHKDKKTVSISQKARHSKVASQSAPVIRDKNDPTNTTIFVGGFVTDIDENFLRSYFSLFGELSDVFILAHKRSGFVQFADRACADKAMVMLNGYRVGESFMILSWGFMPIKKQNLSGSMVQQHADPAYKHGSDAQGPSMNSYQGYCGPGYTKNQQH